MLEQHSKATTHGTPDIRIGVEHAMTEQADFALGRNQQADDLAQQSRLAATGAADHAQDFAGIDRQIDAAMDHRLPEAGVNSANLDDRG